MPQMCAERPSCRKQIGKYAKEKQEAMGVPRSAWLCGTCLHKKLAAAAEPPVN